MLTPCRMPETTLGVNTHECGSAQRVIQRRLSCP